MLCDSPPPDKLCPPDRLVSATVAVLGFLLLYLCRSFFGPVSVLGLVTGPCFVVAWSWFLGLRREFPRD